MSFNKAQKNIKNKLLLSHLSNIKHVTDKEYIKDFLYSNPIGQWHLYLFDVPSDEVGAEVGMWAKSKEIELFDDTSHMQMSWSSIPDRLKYKYSDANYYILSRKPLTELETIMSEQKNNTSSIFVKKLQRD